MDKDKRQKRFQQKTRHINRQTDIYKMYMPYEVQPHKFHKKNALNCGDPKCVMCMNPRKAFGEKTIQEHKFECSAVEQTNRDSIGKWEWEDLNDPAMKW